MSNELAKSYDATAVQAEVTARWDESRAWHTEVDPNKPPFVVVIPPPNVTAALHLGHALNNTVQDILVRWRRMCGDNAVWIPGTDHAGIATQSVVEKRLQREGKRRTDFTREQFIEIVQKWKDEYEAKIIGQLKAMGCSCDWDRTAFTMDEARSKAVREAFFRLFRDGLIYRGKRLVNWDPVTQTALADDEVENEEVDGFFYYLKYPVVSSPSPGTPGEGRGEGTSNDNQFVTVATTRPETMLGDTAVAVNPKDPRAASLRGKFVRLPIVGRIIPFIEDDYVVLPVQNGGDPADPKAQFSSGFLKVTPAHDENDYKLGEKNQLPIINVMAPDASISRDFGWTDFESTHQNRSEEERDEVAALMGQTREAARARVVEYFKKSGLLEATKPYRHSVGHSYRSHVPIEPYLSDQWYVAVKKQIPSMADEGLIEGTDVPKSSLAGLALTALKSGLDFVPERYAKTYENWNANLRDWCISRQLWWGHRIPVWSRTTQAANRREGDTPLGGGKIVERVDLPETHARFYIHEREIIIGTGQETEWFCTWTMPNDPDGIQLHKDVTSLGFAQDPDVLDTWFSSALWPLSTLGWPENTSELARWNPTSTLCTAREIITLWVSRMVMFNRYLMESSANPNAERRTPNARLPFNDVFIHAMIQDGHGQKMSKSLGNGVDPLDIIESHGADAMRFTLCHMTTQTQDLRLPVDCIDPNSGETITPKFFTNKDGYLVASPIQDHKGKKFASSYGAITAEAPGDLPVAKNTSSKFDLGRNFANKLWNASRFVLMQIGSVPNSSIVDESTWSVVDRWILSRLARTVQACDEALKAYRFDQYAKACYDFVWRDFCDWYLEASKPAMRDEKRKASTARILATCLDYSLRLMHPAMPFITEKLWDALQSLDAARGIDDRFPTPSKKSLAMLAPFPKFDERMDTLTSGGAERVVERLQEIIGATRELRNTLKVDQKKKLPITIQCPDEIAHHLTNNKEFIETMALVVLEEASSNAKEPSGAAKTTAAGATIFLVGAVDSATSEKRIGELKKTIASLEGRLSNESYIAKAPPKLVAETKEQLETAKAELAKLGG